MLLRQRLDEHDEASFLAAHEVDLATAQPFTDVRTLESISVPTSLMAACDDAHDPDIAHLYAEHLGDVTVATVDMTEPSSWTETVRAFLPLTGPKVSGALGGSG